MMSLDFIPCSIHSSRAEAVMMSLKNTTPRPDEVLWTRSCDHDLIHLAHLLAPYKPRILVYFHLSMVNV